MKEMKYKICAIVVTFNRKNLLLNCLKAINDQTYKPHTVIIVDNASVDGTIELVKDSGYYNIVHNGINYQYLLLPNNQGGAGGFYNGIKTAFESKQDFDAVWVMDDDGEPDTLQLEELVKYLNKYDYLAPMVLSNEHKNRLAFNYNGSYSVDELINNNGEIVSGYACPFNGIIYTHKLIKTIGYPIPNLFIWGDERNYDQRAKDAGFIPHTVVTAIHNHPSDKLTFGKSLFGKKIILVPNKWKGYCFWRNTIFNAKGHFNLKNYLSFFFYYGCYYLFKEKKIDWFICFVKAYLSGFKKNPDLGFKKYMN